LSDDCLLCHFERDRAPDEWLFQDERWSVGNSYWPPDMSPVKIIPGMVTIQARRHLNVYDMDEDDWLSVGPLVGRVLQAVRQATGAARVYFIELGEGLPHFHINFLPRGDSVPKDQHGINYWAHLGDYVDDDAIPRVGGRIGTILRGR
jgi:diadenosine tetraphosphate (Ap4A) HIT family hydrolase